VDPVDLGLFGGIGRDQVDPGPGEDCRVEAALHREGRPEETKTPESVLPRGRTGHLDDADERDRDPGLDRVEDEMGRVGCDRPGFSSGAGQNLDLVDEIPGYAGEVSRSDQGEHVRDVDAVDEQGRPPPSGRRRRGRDATSVTCGTVGTSRSLVLLRLRVGYSMSATFRAGLVDRRHGSVGDPIGAGWSALHGAFVWLNTIVPGGFGLLLIPFGALALASLWAARRA
jgi:hypothetical protein